MGDQHGFDQYRAQNGWRQPAGWQNVLLHQQQQRAGQRAQVDYPYDMGLPHPCAHVARRHQDQQEQVACNADCEQASIHPAFNHLIERPDGQQQQNEGNPERGNPEVRHGKAHGGIANQRKHEIDRDTASADQEHFPVGGGTFPQLWNKQEQRDPNEEFRPFQIIPVALVGVADAENVLVENTADLRQNQPPVVEHQAVLPYFLEQRLSAADARAVQHLQDDRQKMRGGKQKANDRQRKYSGEPAFEHGPGFTACHNKGHAGEQQEHA